jgi:predicted Rossmann fold nucleotide-binding protein DprA/Smf involved in DNA uptake
LSQRICEALRGNALSADELSSITGIGIGDLLAELTELEIDGKIRSMAGNRFTCI